MYDFMEKASHNTFSYLRPMQWWLRPFTFVARCQSKTLQEQFGEGVRIFDLRLRREKNGEWVIAHNAFVYARGIKILHALEWLDEVARESDLPVCVRLLHEVRNRRQERYSSSIEFNMMCDWLNRTCHNIRFFGGQRVMDWRQDYVFPPQNEIEYTELHASMRWPKYLHWWPWLYAHLHNDEIEKEYQDKPDVVFMDFCGD